MVDVRFVCSGNAEWDARSCFFHPPFKIFFENMLIIAQHNDIGVHSVENFILSAFFVAKIGMAYQHMRGNLCATTAFVEVRFFALVFAHLAVARDNRYKMSCKLPRLLKKVVVADMDAIKCSKYKRRSPGLAFFIFHHIVYILPHSPRS